MNKRNGIDPAKISGPYSLLAVMLLVAEILFAIWFYKSQSSVERTIAGSIMALVFICLMLFVLKMNRTTDQPKNVND
jgi:DMSO/TMAO reductase YedYZ heme-binding membrane subunit